MDKLTPKSFGMTQTRRIARALEGIPLPERLSLISGLERELESLADAIGEAMAPREPDPELETPEPVPGVEATTAPGEPGTVSPTGGPLETPG